MQVSLHIIFFYETADEQKMRKALILNIKDKHVKLRLKYLKYSNLSL